MYVCMYIDIHNQMVALWLNKCIYLLKALAPTEIPVFFLSPSDFQTVKLESLYLYFLILMLCYSGLYRSSKLRSCFLFIKTLQAPEGELI